jgi:hypothetical protein
MKKLNISLLKYIIKTDFFILENKKLLQTKFFNLMSTKNFNVLDIIELNSSMKQQIRLLQFAKKKNFEINIINLNNQFLKIFQAFYTSKKFNIKNKIFFKNNISDQLDFQKFLELFIFFNVKSHAKKDFLISEINSFLEPFNTGKYKLLSNVNSFKKLIVFLSIINNILLNFHK